MKTTMTAAITKLNGLRRFGFCSGILTLEAYDYCEDPESALTTDALRTFARLRP